MSANSPGQAGPRPMLSGRPQLSGQLVSASTEFFETKHSFLKRFLYVLCCLVLFLFFPKAVQAAFIGGYTLSNFAITNSDSVGGPSGTDGFAMSSDSGLSVVLTGGNRSSGLSGVADLVNRALTSGLVHFHYSYASLDIPGLDLAGYLVGNQFFQLSDSDGVCDVDYFASAAFALIYTFSTSTNIQIAAAGVSPQDGFSEDPNSGLSHQGAAHWRGYSTAVATSDGCVWMSTEDISSAVRTQRANVATFIARVQQ